MKKLSVFLSVGFFLVLFVADSFAEDIGLAWVGKSGMAERVEKGFTQGISELAPDIKTEYRKELASMEELEALTAKWSTQKKAMVLLRSNAAEWLGQNPPVIPTFIGACNHPVQLGALKNMESPEGKITGVTYFLPAKVQFDIFTTILPNLKSILLLVEKGHPGSAIDRSETEKICKKLGIKYRERLCETFEEARAAVKAEQDVSAFLFGNQAKLLDNAAQIIQAGGDIPFLSYASRPVNAGALGGFAANDIKLGYMLAQSLIDVVKKGKAVSEVPVKMDPKPTFFVNVATAQKLGLEIPFDILESAKIVE